MAHRRVGQISLAEALVQQRPGVNARLERIGALVRWDRFEKLLSRVYASPEGRPSYPPLVMLKCLLLQQWYALSDLELEEALSDRLSFRRFAGLALDEHVPDHTTICRFRQQLAAHGLAEKLFAELNRQIEARGLIVKKGTLIDATLVEAEAARPSMFEGGSVSEVDPEAGWTKRGSKTFFGYKAHLAVDRGSGMVRGAILTSADVHDSVPADRLIQGDERALYADKAYDSQARRALLVRLGIRDGIMHAARRNRPLTPWQAARNAALAKVRSGVERVFGTLKRSYRYRRVRYRGLEKNEAHLHLLCIALNLRRATVMTT